MTRKQLIGRINLLSKKMGMGFTLKISRTASAADLLRIIKILEDDVDNQ